MSAPASTRDAPIPATGRAADRDRKFRPDVEGLRAVAVGTVVAYHAGIPGVTGGYVGVDVFFVISGYVITRLLLGQVDRRGRPRFGEFYARRARRILPAGGFVAVVSVFFAYRYLGFIRGGLIADDLRWVGVFLGNVHFSDVGTNYFQSELPPSTLQNYWSLAVEEQFYVIYPALITLLTLVAVRTSIRAKLTVTAVAIAVGSFAWSVWYTRHNPAASYFALSTRAWELALGGVVAAGTTLWSRVPERAAALIAWAGLAAIAYASFAFGPSTPYPGWIAVIPVVGSALVILGGVPAPASGPEVVLGTAPFRWIGKLSFSIYLWHWPILMTAEQDAGHRLPAADRAGLLVLVVAASVLTFYGLEDPVRRARPLARRPGLSILIGLAVVATMVLVGTVELHSH
ncbi:MAG TPA: acyltransferase [Acidimicrobiales bacterium]|nr:acyltransferase [Acidimicrobiales bacterium]